MLGILAAVVALHANFQTYTDVVSGMTISLPSDWVCHDRQEMGSWRLAGFIPGPRVFQAEPQGPKDGLLIAIYQTPSHFHEVRMVNEDGVHVAKRHLTFGENEWSVASTGGASGVSCFIRSHFGPSFVVMCGGASLSGKGDSGLWKSTLSSVHFSKPSQATKL